MPFHSFDGPFFRLSDFLWGFVDYLLAHPLAFGLVLAGALLIVVELCLLIAKESARRTAKRRTTDRLAAMTVAQQQQGDALIHARMKSVVSISSRRDKGVA